MKKNLLLWVCILFMLPAFAQTDALRVDFGTSSSPTQTDWQSMTFADKEVPSSEFTSFTAMGTTLQVKVSFIEEAGTAASTRSINRGGSNYSDEKYDLLTDWIAADVMGGTSRTLAIEVTGLPAGTYTWKSYHHDFSDQRGTFIGKIENSAGVISDYGSVYQISLSDPGMTTHPGYANTFLDVSQYFNDAVISAGPTDVIKVYLTYEYPLGHESIDHPNKLLVVNGFELYETPAVLPEIIHVTETQLSFNGSSYDEFYVTGQDLTQDITITAPSGYTVTPSTLSADVVNAKVEVIFDGTAASDGFITLTSGTGETTIAVTGTTYVNMPFKVDFNRTGTTSSEDGWEVIQISDKVNPGSDYFAFSAMEGTVEVLPVFLNNPVDANTRAINRNSSNYTGELNEVLDDWIAADVIAGDPDNGDHCNVLAIKVKGLPEGSYSWKSYHHDNDNQRGKFTGSVETTGGYTYTGTELIGISYSNPDVEGYTDNMDGVTTFMTTFTSTGVEDVITVSFTHEYPYADPYLFEGIQAEKLLVVNGFELAALSTDATLSAITLSEGSLMPDFAPDKFEYKVLLPNGTSSVTITPTANDDAANVSGGGDIDVSAGTATATITVTAEDINHSNEYTFEFYIEDNSCFVPLYDDGRSNLIHNPYLNSLDGFAGWGYKSIVIGNEAYCGSSCAKFDALTNSWDQGAAMDVNNIEWKANTSYRVRFMYKTVDGTLAFLASGTDENKLYEIPQSTNTWQEFDEIFTTGTNTATGFVSINNADNGSTGKVAYIDNWELYEISSDATLSNIALSVGELDQAFDPETTTYTATVPNGTTSVTVAPTLADETSSYTGGGDIDVSTGSGVATIVVTAEDGTEMTYTVTITVDNATSIKDLESTVQIYPTVTSGNVNVVFSDKPGTIKVYSLSGQLMQQQQATSELVEIQLSSKGIYLVEVESNGVKIIEKVIKK